MARGPIRHHLPPYAKRGAGLVPRGETEGGRGTISSSWRSQTPTSFYSARDISFCTSVTTSGSVDVDEIPDTQRVVHCEVEEIVFTELTRSPLDFPHGVQQPVAHRERPSNASAAASSFPIGLSLLLPSDYEQIISRAVSPVEYSSLEQLYLRLCDPTLIDNGSKVVWLERGTAKKCYMLSARALGITWGDNSRFWSWISVPGARGDGWMELEMGDAFIDSGSEALVEVWLKGRQGLHSKSGLIVHGIEIRPLLGSRASRRISLRIFEDL